MAVYTYEVDHGDDAPRIHAGMELNGGRVVAVEFGPALSVEATHKIVNSEGTERGRGSLSRCEELISISDSPDHRIVPITGES